jgi:Api92-like protein with ferredoxin domain
MPNWIKNELTVHGNQEHLDAMRALVASDETVFDLDCIVPMPRDLDIDSGSTSKNAMALFDNSEALFMLTFPWVAAAGVSTIDDLRSLLRERYRPSTKHYDGSPKEVFATLDDLADRIKRNIQEYDAPTWYEWRNENWGTKWNTTNGSVKAASGVVFSFETAWAPPTPVISALAARFPLLNFSLVWRDEYDNWKEKFYEYWAEGKKVSAVKRKA